MVSSSFNRDRLPDWLTYADAQGIKVEGRGTWRSILCDFHADTHASLRINTKSGGWCCMSCGVSGGDVLAHYMQRTGLGFVAAARDLGAWDDAGTAAVVPQRPRTLSAGDGLALLYRDATMVWLLANDIAQGKTLSPAEVASAGAAYRRVMVIYEGVTA